MINPEKREQEKIYGTRPVSEEENGMFQDMWSDVWLEKEYATEENLKKTQEHYELYKDYSSDYFITEDDEPIGTFRLLKKKMPVVDDFPELNISPDKVTEMTLLTLKKEHRTKKEAMISALAQVRKEVVENKLDGAITIIDKRLFFFLKRYLKLPIKPVGPEVDYEGSICVPAFISLEEGSDWLDKLPE